ncbi:MAG: GtrA family protein [Sphaerochaetaceae bacterium]
MEKNTKKELLRTIKYTCIAASAGVIQIGSYTLFYELLRWNAWFSYLISLILSVLWNFTLNRKYTFKSTANYPKAMFKVFLYYLVFTPLSTLWTKYFTENLAWNNYIVEVATILINFVTEFCYQRFYVFKDQLDTNTDRDVKKV